LFSKFSLENIKMTMVSQEEIAAMARLREIMEGKTPSSHNSTGNGQKTQQQPKYVEVTGPGVVTRQEVDAMATVMNRLNNVMNQVSGEMIVESSHDPELREALMTQVGEDGVKIGAYKIKINEHDDRIATKKSFSVINQITGETIAHELGLYEAAHGLVKLLNSGNFINSVKVRKLLESESTYTGQKVDAIRYKRSAHRAKNSGDSHRYELFESRRQRAVDLALHAKAEVKDIYNNIV